MIVSSSVAARARAMVAATAWVDSGAGMMPSARANSTTGLERVRLVDRDGTASTRAPPRGDTIGAIP